MKHDPFAGVDVPERLARQLAFCLEIDKASHDIHVGQVKEIVAGVGPGAPAIHQVVLAMLDRLVADGILPAAPPH